MPMAHVLMQTYAQPIAELSNLCAVDALSKGMTYWAELGAWPTNVAYVLQAVSKPKDTGTLGGYLHGKNLETHKSTYSAVQ